ncbi:MAG: 50S ribosomal protein L20 [Candidatus Pacebacteria bacterium]|jgi:large subunit ribosomal protein L20|nr:50S ribosomal protein L20 [Candidatus Paceibacterota bacterium]
MARTKGGPKQLKRRKNILKQTKGYRHGRSTKKKQALEAIKHAGQHAFRDRRAKKRTMRGLHIVRVNAALRENGFKNYSTFIDALKKKNIMLDRKVLSEMAMTHPESFKRLLAKVA